MTVRKPPKAEKRLGGEVVDFTLFDLGAQVRLDAVKTILGLKPEPAPLLARSPAPQYASFPRPLEVRFTVPASSSSNLSVEVRVHGVGVLAVRVRAPVDVATLGHLVDIEKSIRVDGRTIKEAAHEWLRRATEDLRPAFLDPYPVPVEPESYTVYCVTSGIGSATDFLEDHREPLATLVAGEAREPIVPEVIESSFKHLIRYSHSDALIVGWDNAVILGEPGTYEDILDVIELSNLELLEFRTYDAYLDQKLDQSFLALNRLWSRGGLFRSARSTLQEISHVRAELARLTDSIHDTGKIFGDWYLAKVHQRLNDRFHVSSWERAVAGKMETLEDLFHMAGEETNHRRSLILEWMVIVLFVLDLILIFMIGSI